MTATGSSGDTYGFMPREHLTNFKNASPAGDVWSMAATLYNMLTGELPREEKPGQDLIDVILRGKIVPIQKRDRDVPRAIVEILERALDNDPEQRYPTAAEFRDALKAAAAKN